MQKKILLIVLLVAFVTQIALADGFGSTGANWLRLGVGVRAAALGGHFTGLADDVSGMYWNPAGISQINHRQVDSMHANYLANISYVYFGGLYPLRAEETIGLYYFSLDTPEDKVRTHTVKDGTGEKFDSGASVINLSYARSFSKKLKFGLSAKMLNEDLAGDKVSGFALDVGILYKDLFPKIDAGVMLQNIGPPLRGAEELSSNLRFGLAYHLGRRLILVGDLNKPLEGDADIGVGAEYLFNDFLALRGGYNSLRSFSLGVGVMWHALSFSYAYVPYQGELGVTHRFSFSYDFDFVPPEKPLEDEQVVIEEEEEIESIEELMLFIDDDSLFDLESKSIQDEEIITAEEILGEEGVEKLAIKLTEKSELKEVKEVKEEEIIVVEDNSAVQEVEDINEISDSDLFEEE